MYTRAASVCVHQGHDRSDVAGVMLAVGRNASCAHLHAGDSVWMWVSAGLTADAGGAYAKYAVAPCASTGIMPPSASFVEGAAMPCVGVTSLQCLLAAGAPWTAAQNVTVAVTSGQGGTGHVGIQLAKALGAARVVTAATGAGLSLVRALGADVGVDNAQTGLLDALANDSIDVVYDNFGAKGTADKAMRTIYAGGVFLVLEGWNGGTVSKHPKKGVHQVQFGLADASNHTQGLDVLALYVEAGRLHAHVQHTYAAFTPGAVAAAFTASSAGDVVGKLAIDTSATGSSESVKNKTCASGSIYEEGIIIDDGAGGSSMLRSFSCGTAGDCCAACAAPNATACLAWNFHDDKIPMQCTLHSTPATRRSRTTKEGVMSGAMPPQQPTPARHI